MWFLIYVWRSLLRQLLPNIRCWRQLGANVIHSHHGDETVLRIVAIRREVPKAIYKEIKGKIMICNREKAVLKLAMLQNMGNVYLLYRLINCPVMNVWFFPNIPQIIDSDFRVFAMKFYCSTIGSVNVLKCIYLIISQQWYTAKEANSIIQEKILKTSNENIIIMYMS